MIKLCENSNNFLEICDKLQKVKRARLTQKILYDSMISGLYGGHVFTYVSYDKDKMNGCLVLLLIKDQIGELKISLFFTWIDPHYPKLHKDFIAITDNKAKELQIKKIAFITNRNEKVINKRMGKFGYKKTCSIYEKDVI